MTQDILETAKISQLSWGTFEKEKKEGFAGEVAVNIVLFTMIMIYH